MRRPEPTFLMAVRALSGTSTGKSLLIKAHSSEAGSELRNVSAGVRDHAQGPTQRALQDGRKAQKAAKKALRPSVSAAKGDLSKVLQSAKSGLATSPGAAALPREARSVLVAARSGPKGVGRLAASRVGASAEQRAKTTLASTRGRVHRPALPAVHSATGKAVQELEGGRGKVMGVVQGVRQRPSVLVKGIGKRLPDGVRSLAPRVAAVGVPAGGSALRLARSHPIGSGMASLSSGRKGRHSDGRKLSKSATLLRRRRIRRPH
jgi:hypothetical protein